MRCLYGAPLSHFTRKVRILLKELELDFEFIDVGNVGSNATEVFYGNPLMKIPIACVYWILVNLDKNLKLQTTICSLTQSYNS